MTKKPTHRPFAALAACFAVGIIAGALHHGPVALPVLLTSSSVLAGMLFYRSEKTSTALILCAVIGLGMTCAMNRKIVGDGHIDRIAKYYRHKPMAVRGVIKTPVEIRSTGFGIKTTFTLAAKEVKAGWGWDKAGGNILINIFRDTALSYGDLIELEGTLHRPYDFSPDTNFSYRRYLSHRGIRYILSVKKSADITMLDDGHGNGLKSWALRRRNRLRGTLDGYLSPNEAGIMKAVLLGDRSAISKPVRELFVRTGTAHILAISGLHMGVVAALFLLFAKLAPVGRRVQLTCVIMAVMVYALLTGGRPSVVRATIMIIVLISSYVIEREPDALNSLFVAAMLILIYNPMNLFDIGFQLSFTCVGAIIAAGLAARKIKAAPARTDPMSAMRAVAGRSLLISLAVWVAVAGWIAYYFGIITPVTIIANLFVVPLISAVVALGFGLLIAGGLIPVCAPMFAVCLKVLLNLMVAVIFLADKLPFSHFYIRDVRGWHIAVYYMLFLPAVFAIWPLSKPIARGIWARFFPGGAIDKRARV